MKVGLFIPCYINALYPQVGVASFKLLKSLGLDVYYPQTQTCCGQPMANAGYENHAAGMAAHFDELFRDYNFIVGPSSSCVAFIRNNYARLMPDRDYDHICYAETRTYDICEFIHDMVKPSSLRSYFPHKVSIQNSCHGVRLMDLSAASELNVPYYNKLKDLLSMVRGIEIAEPERCDECCGFGGMFSIEEDAVSVKMGLDKVIRHMATGAEYIVGADSACLMHQEGIIRREHMSIKTIHIAEVLAAGL